MSCCFIEIASHPGKHNQAILDRGRELDTKVGFSCLKGGRGRDLMAGGEFPPGAHRGLAL